MLVVGLIGAAGDSICGDEGGSRPGSRLASKRKVADQDIPQSCRPGFKGAPSDDGPEDDEKDYRSDLGYIRQRNVRNGF